MSRLDEVFAGTSARGELALVAYLTAGFPHPAETVGLIATAADAGADIVELGVPFSDPMGDGPTIQASSQQALAAGMSLARTLDLVEMARGAGVTVPIALMGYCNPFLRYGLKKLFEDAAGLGIDALVVPDLPAHEADEWLELSRPDRATDGLRTPGNPAPASGRSVDMVFFVAPGSRPERVAYTASRGSGFLYCLAANGVTGARENLDTGIADYLSRVRAATTLPLAVGFGIAQARHVHALRGTAADAAIVGSALVQRLAAAGSAAARRAALSSLVSELKDACR
jgi:tryptophan synthase alpha subunit